MMSETEPVTCREIQQRFYENLGNREYDCFQPSEDKYLKLKIGFTLFGTPQDDDKFNNLDGDYTIVQVYNEKQNEIINNIYSVIKARSIHNEDRDQVVVSFMFNCCEFPLKRKRKNTHAGDNLGCFPIFRVRKCSGSPTNKNCCVFIDEHSRTYKSWDDYLRNNKIPKAKMFVPKDGKYQGNMEDRVQLEELPSPACDLKEDIKKVADYSTTAASLVSGGIAIGAMIPAITVAPIVLTGALLTGAGVGVYSMIRSSLVLRDRKKHSQSISLANNEARNCYLNIAAGATSVVTTGATKVATVVLNKGVAIGEGAATALLSVNALNITVNGCNVANSIYSIASDIKNKKSPSTLDIVHLTTTFLFFGNAVVNFRSAYTIYNDTQSISFADMVKTRSQDLWNRAKTQFFKADMTSTDNNSSMKVINDSGDYCSNVIQIAIREKGSEISQNTAFNLLKNLLHDIISLDNVIKFGFTIIENKDNAYALCQIILSRFEYKVQETMIVLLKYLLDDVIQAAYEPLNQIFPKTEKVVIFLNFITNFIKFKVTELEIKYQQKKAGTIRNLQISEDEYDDNAFRNNAERMTYYLKLTVLKMICCNGHPEELLFREMIRYFWDWLNEQAFQHSLKMSLAQNNQDTFIRDRKIVNCRDCGGYYYTD